MLAIERCVWPIPGPHALDVARGARSQSVERTAAPVVDVVPAGATRNAGGRASRVGGCVTREVGDFVLLESRGFSALHQFLIHRAGQILVLGSLAGAQSGEQGSVFLVDDFVAGQMLAAQAESLVQSFPPDVQGLARDRKHEIHVDIPESRLPQDVEGLENHGAGVDAPKAVEQHLIKGLHPHRNPVHAEIQQQSCLVERDGGRVAFDRPLGCAQQIQSFHRAKDELPLAQVQQ